ncbi:MAG: hypothetical protein WBC22_18670 [Sedimentisphaerales bacterium]
MERICKNCKYFVVTGTSFDKRNKNTQEFGVCHKPGGNAKKVKGKLVGGDLMWDDETCKAFKQDKKQF